MTILLKNPADHTSKGLKASDILSTNWLSGPGVPWKENVHEEPRPSTDLMVGDPEVKTIKAIATTARDCADFLDHLSRISTWMTLLKVVARIIRLFKRQRCHTNVVAVKELKQ